MSDLIVIGLSFLEGLALIVSPCILPILPIVLAGSIDGSKKRPLGIITGFILFFTIFTFFSRLIVQYSGVDLNLVRHMSYFVLLLLAVIMLSNYLTAKFALWTRGLANVGADLAQEQGPGFGGGVIFGGLIALVWTPCVGPILAAVLVQTISQQSSIIGFFSLLSFSIGVGLPMLVIALFGRRILSHFEFVKTHTELLRKLLGLVIILSVVYIMNLEYRYTSVETKKIEVATPVGLKKSINPYPAPSIAGATQWINSPPLSMESLRGKVVLIDFWTYSCINCIRTLPYIKGWYEKYHDKGLVIIGVHTPEFEFEKNPENVAHAVEADGILYPVAMDNDYAIWRSFQNRYWPAHYLIDKNGDVVYTHFGEGEYAVTENNIRYLLNLDKEDVAEPDTAATGSYWQTPETYFGYDRMQGFVSPQSVMRDKNVEYTKPKSLSRNEWALQGGFTIKSDRIIAESEGAALTIHFYARNVYVVAGTKDNKPIPIKIMLDGRPLVNGAGKDVVKSELIVSQSRLYEVLTMSAARDGELTLIMQPGVELYTFTFG